MMCFGRPAKMHLASLTLISKHVGIQSTTVLPDQLRQVPWPKKDPQGPKRDGAVVDTTQFRLVTKTKNNNMSQAKAILLKKDGRENNIEFYV